MGIATTILTMEDEYLKQDWTDWRQKFKLMKILVDKKWNRWSLYNIDLRRENFNFAHKVWKISENDARKGYHSVIGQ